MTKGEGAAHPSPRWGRKSTPDLGLHQPLLSDSQVTAGLRNGTAPHSPPASKLSYPRNATAQAPNVGALLPGPKGHERLRMTLTGKHLQAQDTGDPQVAHQHQAASPPAVQMPGASRIIAPTWELGQEKGLLRENTTGIGALIIPRAQRSRAAGWARSSGQGQLRGPPPLLPALTGRQAGVLRPARIPPEGWGGAPGTVPRPCTMALGPHFARPGQKGAESEPLGHPHAAASKPSLLLT